MKLSTRSRSSKNVEPSIEVLIESALAMTPEERREKLTPREIERLATAWPIIAHDKQLEPTEAYRTWLFLGGRGAGKTRAGAEWLVSRVRTGERLALIGPTLHDVREVMVEGPSGLLAVSRERGVRWEASRRRLVWNGGGVAYAFSAEDPDSLRGPQFHHAWADEFCAWKKPAETLAMLRFGLRLGAAPQLMVSTTPRPIPALKALMAQPGVVTERAPTSINAANLSPDFVADLTAVYGGTRLAAQELDGLVVEDLEGALWRLADLERARGAAPARFERIVVGLDPPITATGDACGIVVCGLAGGRGYVLADRSARGLSPLAWAGRAVRTARDFDADLIVAEANQGGDMVGECLRIGGADRPVKLVHATRGKRARAEPVAALYEQGRVVHCGLLGAIAKSLGEIEARLEDLAGSPALSLTPGAWAAGHDEAVAGVRRQAQEDLRKAETTLRQATQRIEAAAGRERSAKSQRRWVVGACLTGLAVGTALYAVLAGPIVRALPARWQAPERLAAATLDLNRWAAGQRLMALANPRAWADVARGSKLVTANRQALDECAEAAAKAGEAVRCRVEIAPPAVSGPSGQD